MQWCLTPENLNKIKFDRTYGPSAPEEDLIDDMQKRQVRKYFALKNHNKRELSSKIDSRIREWVSETPPTVSDGILTFH